MKPKIILVYLISFFFSLNIISGKKKETFSSGIRISTYGIKPMPSLEFWAKGLNFVNKNFSNSKKSVIIVVGNVKKRVYSYLNFPLKTKYPFILFNEEDLFEEYLNYFDKNSVDVWLQVEPANGDVKTLIKLVLDRYSVHKCVIGVGIDVEWYKWRSVKYGMRVSDSQAILWEKIVKSYNKNYRLFLKHWKIEKMPPNYRGDIVFVSDSQQFKSLDGLMEDFTKWAKAFYPNNVAFQIGYPRDEVWWGKFRNPVKDIGDVIIKNIPNTSAIFWVDFSLKKVLERQQQNFK